MSDPQEARWLSRYEVLRPLGSGGMGTVQEVLDRDRGLAVALKSVRAAKGVTLYRFKREFRSFADLDHPNLVRLYDLHADGDRWAYTMELVRGTTLLEAVRCRLLASPEDATTYDQPPERPTPTEPTATPGRPRPPACDLPTLYALLPQILDALEYLHLRGLVHLDIKPANVLVDASGRLRLVDFGIGKSLDDPAQTHAAGAVVGTIPYMAPEQVRGGPIGPAADIYALGSMIFQLVTGEFVHSGTALGMLHRLMVDPPRRMDALVPGLSPALAEIGLQMLSRDPAERPRVAEIRLALGLRRLGPDPQPVTITPFVGREAVLAHLERWMEGAGGLLVLRGESGSGKSTVQAEIARRARARGWLVFSGRCYEREALPFRAFDAIADQLAFTIKRWPEKLRREAGDEIAAAAALFPVFSIFSPPPGAGDPALRRYLGFGALRALLERASTLAPVLLNIDDLQWTDAESTQLLQHLDQRRPARVYLLGAMRPGGLETVDAHAGEVLEIPPMNAEEIAALSAAVLGRPADAVAVSLLTAQSAGNPLLAAALLREWDGKEGSLPPDLAAILEARLSRLSEHSRRLLDLCCAAGGACPEPVLRASFGLGSVVFTDVSGVLVREDLLRMVPGEGAERRFDLSHDRLREVGYAALDPEQRRRAHQQLGEAFEATEAHPEVLLSHWRAAGDPERLVRYLDEAADAAVAALAFERGITLLSERLSYARSASERSPLLARRAELREHLGDIAGANDDLSEAIGQLDPEDPTRRPLQLHHVANLLKLGRLRAGLAEAEELMRAAGLRAADLYPGEASARRRLRRLGLGLRVLLQAALPRFTRRAAEPEDRWRIDLLRKLVEAFFLVNTAISTELGLRLLSVLQRLDDPLAGFYERGVHTVILTSVGGLTGASSRASQLVEELPALAPGLEPRSEALIIDSGRGRILMRAGHFREAERFFGERLQRLAAAGLSASWEGQAFEDSRVAALGFLGELDEVERIGALLLASGGLDRGPNGFRLLFLGIARARTGRLDALRALLERWRPHAESDLPSNALMYCTLLEGLLDAAEGRGDTIIARWPETTARFDGAGLIYNPYERALFASPLFEAATQRGPGGTLPAAAERLLRRELSRIAGRYHAGFAADAWRVRALLEPDPRRARAAMGRALELSSRSDQRWERWRSLGAARRMGMSSPEQDAEWAALGSRHGFWAPESSPDGAPAAPR